MFMLILQFFWVYIDDLMGKGLSVGLILELIFYVSASLVPLALPLAILLSSLMTFGNLAENNELTALKSSGMSLFKIMRPLTILVIFIAFGTFLFANYVIPVANLKWHSLIYDIQNTKISTVLTPGVYTKDFEGFAIKVKDGKDSVYYGVTIHDHSNPNEIRTVKAKSARVYRAVNGQFLFFDLTDGNIFEEINIQSPLFDPTGYLQNPNVTGRPQRVSSFKRATYKLNLSGYILKRSDDDIFTDKYEMMNVFQINEATDSLRKRRYELVKTNASTLKNDRMLFSKVALTPGYDSGFLRPEEVPIVALKDMEMNDRKAAVNGAIATLQRSNQAIDNQIAYLSTVDHESALYWVEFHRKFALTLSIVILFFVGAPLGALVKKGGFGAPVVIAAIIFMIYFVLTSIGDNLAKTFTVSPFFGMWLAAMVFAPIAVWISRTASNDGQLTFSRK